MSKSTSLARITLVVSSSSSNVHSLAELFPDIVVNQWKTGEPTEIENRNHTYHLVRLLIGDGNYSAALRDTKAWLSRNGSEVSQFAQQHEAAGIDISIPFQIENEHGSTVLWRGRSIRVPFSLVKLCHDNGLEISFDVQYDRNGQWPISAG